MVTERQTASHHHEAAVARMSNERETYMSFYSLAVPPNVSAARRTPSPFHLEDRIPPTRNQPISNPFCTPIPISYLEYSEVESDGDGDESISTVPSVNPSSSDLSASFSSSLFSYVFCTKKKPKSRRCCCFSLCLGFMSVATYAAIWICSAKDASSDVTAPNGGVLRQYFLRYF